MILLIDFLENPLRGDMALSIKPESLAFNIGIHTSATFRADSCRNPFVLCELGVSVARDGDRLVD
jgi:hypothetical protein